MKMPDPSLWVRISPALDELLEMGAAGRRRRLAQLKASSGSEFAAQLESLLSASEHAGASDFLGVDLREQGMAPPSLVGTRIGPFRIEEHIGGGGTGSVWRASWRRGEIALKLLHMSLVGHTAAQRFRREGAILARLDHPSIARYIAAGVTSFGQPYIALELVDGVPIDEACDAQRMPVGLRIELFERLLDAVAYAHARSVIHRDIKPGNVLVTRGGDVKLLDFGIAKLATQEAQALTDSGTSAMTPFYAAPEQLRRGTVTAGADVFALGLVLCRLVSGCDAFMRHRPGLESARRGKPHSLRAIWDELSSDEALLRRTCAERGETPGSLREHLRALDDVMGKALCVDAEGRYSDAGEFATGLRAAAARSARSGGPC